MCPEGNEVWLDRSGRSRPAITFKPPVSALVTIKPCASEYVNRWKSLLSVARLTRKETPIAGPKSCDLPSCFPKSSNPRQRDPSRKKPVIGSSAGITAPVAAAPTSSGTILSFAKTAPKLRTRSLGNPLTGGAPSSGRGSGCSSGGSMGGACADSGNPRIRNSRAIKRHCFALAEGPRKTKLRP